MILLSFDTEEFDVPREHGVEFTLQQGMDVSKEGVRRILDCLKQNGVKATFFCTGNFAENAPELMQRIMDEGHEVACHTNRIRELYGNPYMSGYVNDTILIYQYTGPSGYSYACGEMDFFFEDTGYCEADVFIRSSVELLLNRYLDERFTLETILGDTLYLYRFKFDNNIICGKFDSHNQWDEICLFYIKIEDIKFIDAVLNKRNDLNIRRKD